jgi:hypothetical protein
MMIISGSTSYGELGFDDEVDMARSQTQWAHLAIARAALALPRRDSPGPFCS